MWDRIKDRKGSKGVIMDITTKTIMSESTVRRSNTPLLFYFSILNVWGC